MRSLIVIPISVPPNVQEDMLLAELPIPRGRITYIHIDIPAGVQYMAGFRIENNRRSIIPFLSYETENTNAWLDRYVSGDSSEIRAQVDIPIEEGSLEIHGINFNDVEARFLVTLVFEMVGGGY